MSVRRVYLGTFIMGVGLMLWIFHILYSSSLSWIQLDLFILSEGFLFIGMGVFVFGAVLVASDCKEYEDVKAKEGGK